MARCLPLGSFVWNLATASRPGHAPLEGLFGSLWGNFVLDSNEACKTSSRVWPLTQTFLGSPLPSANIHPAKPPCVEMQPCFPRPCFRQNSSQRLRNSVSRKYSGGALELSYNQPYLATLFLLIDRQALCIPKLLHYLLVDAKNSVIASLFL